MPGLIEDYGLIGDLQTAALVGRDGSIDWLCLPRFDSPACFAALLDDERAGRWRLAPAGGGPCTRRRYRGDSLVLETEWDTPDGSVRVIDAMPLRGEATDVVRVVEGRSGRVPMSMELVLRFDYGSVSPWVRQVDGQWSAIAGPDAAWLASPVAVEHSDNRTSARFEVEAGQRVPFVLTHAASHVPAPKPVDGLQALEGTEWFWKDWIGRCNYRGEWAQPVRRSLITLKALTYAPTGGIVAAATTSLPEQLGGSRNWDYRYCWLRDATFTLQALLGTGYVDEAKAWREWLLRAVAGDPADLRITAPVHLLRPGAVMRALTVPPGRAGPLAVTEVPEPVPGEDELLVDGLAVGVCGTDREIAAGEYGWVPPGRDRLVLGHESLGRVRHAPTGSGFTVGDLVAGVVRRPDPVPCGACAHGQFDMCRNGRYTERGIKQLDGYASQRWRVEAGYAVRLDPRIAGVGVLMEPTSVVAKAWDQIERIGRRSWFDPQRVLITGAGPIGLLAALLAVQRGLDTHVLDVVTGGPKPELVRALGATYHHDGVASATRAAKPDIVIEATGVSSVVFDAIAATAPYGIVCLTGISATGRRVTLDGGALNRELVLENDAVVGSVNANLHHYDLAAAALARADLEWLDRLITRRVPLDRAGEAFDSQPDDVKVVITLDGS